MIDLVTDPNNPLFHSSKSQLQIIALFRMGGGNLILGVYMHDEAILYVLMACVITRLSIGIIINLSHMKINICSKSCII
jgi:hypothetical protein